MSKMSVKGYGGKPEGDHSYGDGLVLKVSPKGVSTWYLRFKVNGKWTMRSLGRASAMCNTTRARQLAADMKEEAKAGLLQRRGEKVDARKTHRNSLGGLLTLYAGEQERLGHWSAEYAHVTEKRLDKHIEPLWRIQAADLTRPQIIRHLESLPSREIASQMYGHIKNALEDACDRGEIPFVVLGRKPKSLTVSKNEVKRRASYGSDLDSLRALYNEIRLSERARSVRFAGQLSILTGLRLGEIVMLRPEYIQGEDLVIPRVAMKVKTAWRGDYILPMSEPVQTMINRAAETVRDGWLLPGRDRPNNVRHEGIEQMFRSMTSRQHTPHGSRTSLLTWALEQGHPPHICKALLDHTTATGATEHYDQSQFVEQRRGILQKWGEVITQK